MTSRKRALFLGTLLVALVALTDSGCGGGGTPPTPISVNAFSTAHTVDESRSASVSATVLNDPASKGVTWQMSGTGCNGSACGTLSNQTSATATYTAPSGVTSNLSIIVMATSVADSTKSGTVSLTVVPPPSITTTSLPTAAGGAAYSATLQGAGGVPPYSWNVTSGALPAGIALSNSGTISGTSCAAATSSFTVQLADSANPPLTASAPLTLTITVVPLSITTTSLPQAVTDTIYNQAVQPAGGISPFKFSVVNGLLPSWATLNTSTGRITGIPGTTGTANFSIEVVDSECSPQTFTQALSINAVTQAGANDSELTGHYAFLFNGFDDLTGSQVAIAGSFAADGKGNITEGIEDENGPSGPTLNIPFTGTFDIGSDNRGAFTITTASGSRTYAVALNSIASGVASQARFVEFDDTTGTNGRRGSGLLRLQNPSAFTLASITGPYAFGFAGQNAAGGRQAIAGSFTANGSGTISSGIADQNAAGTLTNPSLTGTYTTPTSTDGRGSITLTPSTGSTLDLTAYVVSAGEFLAMTTDTFSSDGVVSGSILSQTSASFTNSSLNAPAVYYQQATSGGSTTASLAEIGLFTPLGSAQVSVTIDNNSSRSRNFTATYSVANNGRVTTTGWFGTSPFLYLVDTNKAFFLDASAGVGLGFLQPQAAAPAGGFTSSSFSGTFSAGTVAPSISANVNATGIATLNSSPGFSESATASTPTGLFVSQTTTGAYAVSSNGRGTITSLVITTAGVSGPVVGFLLLLLVLFARRISRRNLLLSALAILLIALLIAPTAPAMRHTPPPSQFAFYVISPTKAVMIHQAVSDTTPSVIILEQ